jgi:Tol biopolymer transport system component
MLSFISTSRRPTRAATLSLLGVAVGGWLGACSSAPGGRDGAQAPGQAEPGAVRQRLAEAPLTRRVSSEWVDLEGRTAGAGRFQAMVDWSSGDLALRNLSNGSITRLTANKGWSEFAGSAAISPDERFVAYAWFVSEKSRYQLRLYPLSGPDSGQVRVILDEPDVVYPMPQAWTADGREVLATIQRTDQANQIIAVPLPACTGCTRRVLRTFDWRYPYDLSISPDGRWLAYDFPPTTARGERNVYVMALDGGRESTIAASSANDLAVGWSTDGSHLFVSSERAGSPSLYAVPMNGGKASGEPVLIRADLWGIFPLGTTSSGGIVYGVNTGRRDILTVSLDPSGRANSRATSILSGSREMPGNQAAWSPDGQHIAYVTNRGSAIGFTGPTDIVIRAADRTEVRRLSPKLSRVGAVSWYRDGSALLLHSRDEKGRGLFMRMDLKTGALATLYTEQANSFTRAPNLSPDGNTLYFIANSEAAMMPEVVALDIRTGRLRVVLEASRNRSVTALALSPDARELAVLHTDRDGEGGGVLSVMPVSGGNVRELHKAADTLRFSYGVIEWLPDGSGIVAGMTSRDDSEANPSTELVLVPAAGGAPKSMGISEVGIRSVRVSPDGRRATFNVFVGGAELWKMEPPKLDGGRVATRR